MTFKKKSPFISKGRDLNFDELGDGEEGHSDTKKKKYCEVPEVT